MVTSSLKSLLSEQLHRLNCDAIYQFMMFEPDWSFQKKRKQVREMLVEALKQQALSTKEKHILLTPGSLIQIPQTSVSISHSAVLGGFVFSSSYYLGLDLEQEGRAKEKTTLRISNPKELRQAPFISFLWSAKEASYKCLSQIQNPLYIRQIDIFNWTEKGSGIFDYQFKTKTNEGQGTVFSTENVILALSFFKK